MLSLLLPRQKTELAQHATVAGMHALHGMNAVAVQINPAHNKDFLILAIWAGGALLMLAYMLVAQFRYQCALAIQRSYQGYFLSSRENISPALVGVFRPRIVVPADFHTRYDDTEQMLILAHEHGHLRHGDHWWNGLAVLLRCVFWFHPLLPLAHRWFRLDQEVACDAAVVAQHASQKSVYLSAMLKTTLQMQAAPVACTWQTCHPLKERIMRIKNKRPGKNWNRFGVVLIFSAAVACTAMSWASQTTAPQAPASAAIALGKEGSQPVAGKGKDRYMINNKITFNGKTFTPKVMVAGGDEAKIAFNDDNEHWEFLMTVAKNPESKNTPTIVAHLTVTKDGEKVLTVPKLVSSLDVPINVTHSTNDHKTDVDVELIVSFVK